MSSIPANRKNVAIPLSDGYICVVEVPFDWSTGQIQRHVLTEVGKGEPVLIRDGKTYSATGAKLLISHPTLAQWSALVGSNSIRFVEFVKPTTPAAATATVKLHIEVNDNKAG